MTYLEKARELRPTLSENLLIIDYCPHHLKLEPFRLCKGDSCADCWNREMPVEVKHEQI